MKDNKNSVRKIKSLKCTTYASPHQIWGDTVSGEVIYIRERSEQVTVAINYEEIGWAPVCSYTESEENCYPIVLKILNKNGFDLSLEEFNAFLKVKLDSD